MIHRLLAFVLASLAVSSSAQAARHYVDIDASGANDGSSWADAYVDLQSALGVASSEDEIWVAEGTYKPTSGTDRSATFALVSGVAMYGGFAGSESELAERNWDAQVTELSGEIGDPTRQYDNTYNLVTAIGLGPGTVLDGFELRDADAQSSGLDGGGVRLVGGELVIRHGKIDCTSAVGGGIYNEGAALTLDDVVVRGHAGRGAGIANVQGATATIDNCAIIAVSWDSAGAMYNSASRIRISNSGLGGNAVRSAGGILSEDDCDVEIRDSVIGGCYADSFAGMIHIGGKLVLERVRFHDNMAAYDQGGALACSGEVRIVSCQFWYNSARGGSGALSSWGNVTVINSTFQWNGVGYGRWYSGAGAILVSAGQLTVINSTFAQNGYSVAPGESLRGAGAIYVENGVVSLENSIFWGNSSNAGAQEILLDQGSNAASHCLIAGSGGSGSSWDSAVGIDLGGNLDLDPLFVDVAHRNLQLNATSPAINAGDSSLFPPDILFDLAGNARITGSAIDMGAYESLGIVPVRRLSVGGLRALFNKP